MGSNMPERDTITIFPAKQWQSSTPKLLPFNFSTRATRKFNFSSLARYFLCQSMWDIEWGEILIIVCEKVQVNTKKTETNREQQGQNDLPCWETLNSIIHQKKQRRKSIFQTEMVSLNCSNKLQVLDLAGILIPATNCQVFGMPQNFVPTCAKY